MKEYLWRWLFWCSLVYCGLLSISLIAAYILFSTAPHNKSTPIFAIGFGLGIGFIGLGSVTLILFERITRKMDDTKEDEGEFMIKVMRETPFFSFSLLYFFGLALYMGIFMLMLSYIRNAVS